MGGGAWSGSTSVADGHGEPLGGPSATVWPIDDLSLVGEVRRAAEAAALAAGLSDTERGTMAVVITELATNLARHARGGSVLLSTIGEPGAAGIEVIALDSGPGIANIDAAITDGFSTGGTSGHGLGAMRRMAHEFDVYSIARTTPGAGTALVARVWSAAGQLRTRTRTDGARVGVVCVPLKGEHVCGDAWLVQEERDRTIVVIADGLGHGPDAAMASSAAIRVVRESRGAPPLALMNAVHGALRTTRGAAMAIAVLRPAERALQFVGVGNISAAVHAAGTTRSLASHNGTVGHAMRSLQEFAYEWPDGATLIMHSDGLNTRWRLDAYPGLLRHDPSLLAGVLYRDAARGRDDATVLAVRSPDR